RWGSCSTDNVLTLNTHLVKAPRDCIDYVILHELCHLRERNHGTAFYRLLKLVLPEWEARKTYLDQHAFRFLS
ncbi:MAG: M48 family metallopeptidase, partial [Thiolinea sp.]